MALRVAVPDEHAVAMGQSLAAETRGAIEWCATGPADVVIGVEGTGSLIHCARWPGLDGALALLDAGLQRNNDRENMARLHDVGRALAAERDPDRLLERILTEGRALLRAEAGSIYLCDEDSAHWSLIFAYTQNARVTLPFHRERIPMEGPSIAGYVARTNTPLLLEDVYALPDDAPYEFNPHFDLVAGYKTTSMLVVPMNDPQGQTLGVLQFINRLASDGAVVPFRRDDIALAQSLAAQAGVALKNTHLRQEIENLFEGFVRAAVTAIESRDPTTSGHSGRVADFTVSLADVIDRVEVGPYAATRFSTRQIQEIRYASLLHDFGKVGVREQVLVKAKKLDPARMELILQRLRQRELEVALALLREQWVSGAPFDPARWESVLHDRAEESERWMALLRVSNEPSVLPAEVANGVGLLSDVRFRHWSGEERSVVEPDDLRCLSIPRGSLSPEERHEIEGHVTHTWRFLQQIPWTRELAGVPEIAYAHHERMSGKGYPRGLRADEIPVQSRAMAISDIFDALTASDRPYKGALSVERSLSILEAEARADQLDADLVKLFIDAKVFDRVRTK